MNPDELPATFSPAYEQAQMQAAAQELARLQGLDLNAYAARYLAAWQVYYTKHPHYLYPDDLGVGFDDDGQVPRPDDVSALSYGRTEQALRRARQDTRQNYQQHLADTLAAENSLIIRRHLLAEACYRAFRLLTDWRYHQTTLVDLTTRYTPQGLNWAGRFDRHVDDPVAVGEALGVVDFLTDACAEYARSSITQRKAAGGDQWAGVLNNYTLTETTQLLVFVGLLDSAEPLAVAQGTKPGQWVAVAAALYEAKKASGDKAALYRAFRATYGPAVGSLSSFSRDYNPENERAKLCYTRARVRLK